MRFISLKVCVEFSIFNFISLLHQSGVICRRVKSVWGEKKNLGKCTIYISIEVVPRLPCPAFLIFTSFNTAQSP